MALAEDLQFFVLYLFLFKFSLPILCVVEPMALSEDLQVVSQNARVC
jgi:hypothetical protein